MLEAEIKRLSENIEHLNKLLEAMANSAKLDATPAPKVEAPKEQEAPSDEPSDFTHDSLKSMALAIAKMDRAKSKDIKAKLAEHDAKVMTDLSGDALRAVGEWLTDLKQEVGA